MFPVVLLLVAVLSAVVSQGLPEEAFPFGDPGAAQGILLTAVFALLPLVVGEIDFRRVRRRLARSDAVWDDLTRRVSRARRRLHLVVGGAYLAALFAARWGSLVARLGIDDWILVDETLLLLPFFVAVAGAWVQEHRIVRLLQPTPETIGEAVGFRARLYLIPILPLATLAAARDAVLLAGLEGYFLSFEYLGWASLVAFIVVVFVASPFLLRAVLRVHPLPRGELRSSLEAMGERIGFRCREILVWRTGHRILNAAIVGLAPRLRYVLLTDFLLESLPPREIAAVYAHEAGHGVNRHAPFYLAYSLLFVVLAFPLSFRLPEANLFLSVGVAMALFVVYWFALFGFVSRRAEREADLFGAQAVGDPEAMAGALDRIAFLAGERKRLAAWRHFSTERRIACLRRFATEPALLDRARRVTRLMFAATLAGLAAASFLALRDLPLQQARGRVQLALWDGNLERLDRAVQIGTRRYPKDPWFVFMAGVGAAERRRDEEAVGLFRRALELGPSPGLAEAIRDELESLGPTP